jgi:hypothetical protein
VHGYCFILQKLSQIKMFFIARANIELKTKKQQQPKTKPKTKNNNLVLMVKTMSLKQSLSLSFWALFEHPKYLFLVLKPKSLKREP